MSIQNFKLHIQYDGSRYNGWQNQKNTQNTIQTKLETVLSRMVDAPVQLSASGRTDAGVHARGQVANFKADTTMTCEQVLSYLNQYLPQDIAVTTVELAEERFHSRLNATEKTYVYRIWRSEIPDVFQRNYRYTLTCPLDLDAMRQAASFFWGTHDFQSFCATKPGKKSTVRTLSTIELTEKGKELRFTFTGNGFLYHMVRILVGTLLEVGQGRRQPSDMAALLEAKERGQAGYLVPAEGLCLERVEYGKDA